MSRWSEARVREWKSFTRALGRMGRLLQRQKNPEGVYVPVARQSHPLLDIVIKAQGVIAAIGDVVVSEDEQKSVLSWVSLKQGEGAATIRLWHKGTKERCEQAMDAAAAALRRFGRRVSFRDMIRGPDQNSYLMLLRVPDAAPVLGFAR